MRGRRFKVHKLVQPGPLQLSAGRPPAWTRGGHQAREAGARLAASYVNFYIGNRRVVGALLDPRATARASPARGAVPRSRDRRRPGREILLGGGNVHCITQQVRPAACAAGAAPRACAEPVAARLHEALGGAA